MEIQKEKNVTGIEIRFLDYCLPDYFQGSNAPEVLCIPVHKEMTLEELKDDLELEFRTSDGFFTDFPECEDWFKLSLDNFGIDNSINPSKFKPFNYAPTLGEMEENFNGESVYAYFGLFTETE